MLETKNLRWTKDRFSTSILSARLISVLDFIFAISNDAARGQNFQADLSERAGAEQWIQVVLPNEGAR